MSGGGRCWWCVGIALSWPFLLGAPIAGGDDEAPVPFKANDDDVDADDPVVWSIEFFLGRIWVDVSSRCSGTRIQ